MGLTYDLIVRGGRVVLPDGVRAAEIGIKDGKIAAVAERLDAEGDCEVLDASGRVVMPGMIDAHVHLNEPGLGAWEGFASGSAALAAGGCTTYIDMPLNGVPPTVNPAALRAKLVAAEGWSYTDYALWGGLVPGNREHLRALQEAGCIGFKAFMSEPGGEGEDIFARADDVTLLEGMREIAALGGVLALHAESEMIVSKLTAAGMEAGRSGALDYAASRPVVAETEAVNRSLFYAEQTGCAVHFVHISSPEAVALITAAKRRGLDVTVETCPHYLVLEAGDMETIGNRAKCAPPLRGPAEREGLWQALKDGELDLVASDHSPCPPQMKLSANWFEVWGGISGAQSSLELLVDEGHLKRGIALERIAGVLSEGPAKRFGLDGRKGRIAEGFDADLALVDLQRGYTLTEDHLLDRHRQSPYVGRTFGCRVTATVVRGRIVYEAERGLTGEPAGVWIRPQVRSGSEGTAEALAEAAAAQDAPADRAV
ncbi:allantoinase [Paenibacillus caseinilyticus]|uniref:Allantoinase n=1 Tax=Paenibacillus mucilaginosus K02 TaxID=997761 RepID=I0BJM3_9BACL|nr:allantoinase [Paenibacillus mucilaginosus]AFH62570.1 allantoinase [Paenibacillus mucilaginosus K02]